MTLTPSPTAAASTSVALFDLLERVPGLRTVDGGGSAAHLDCDTDGLSHLLFGDALARRAAGVAGDASAAALGDGDADRDQFLLTAGQGTVLVHRAVDGRETLVDLGDVLPKFLRRGRDLLEFVLVLAHVTSCLTQCYEVQAGPDRPQSMHCVAD